MRYTKRLSAILPVLLLLSGDLLAQHDPLKEIDSLMKSSYQAGAFNGNVLVSKSDKILYNASFGFTDASNTVELTPDYRFNIGSITKEFSAVALMQLKEQGKLKLSDKVSGFIPELPQWAHAVSIQHLLQYTSGLPLVNWPGIKGDKDLFDGLMRSDTLQFKPGTQYQYNSNNIFLRQFIVERITKMPFKAYAEKYIFRPCKMNSAKLTPLTGNEYLARGFNNKLVADKADLPVTGGTYLTTADLLKWANALHRNSLISKESLYELGQGFDSQEAQSALGKARFKSNRLVRHLHDGRSGSFEAILVSDIDEQFTVILLSNNYKGKVSEISDAIAAILSHRAHSVPQRN